MTEAKKVTLICPNCEVEFVRGTHRLNATQGKGYCSIRCARSGARSIAKGNGESLYAPEKPCKRGHLVPRRVSNGACPLCELEFERRRGPDRHKRYYQKDPEKGRRKSAAWRSRNRDKALASYKRAYWADVDKARAKTRQWRLDNAERNRLRQRQWKLENPDKWRAAWKNAKARRRGAIGSFCEQDIEAIRLAQKNKCAYCRTSLISGHHLDHITPLSKGGTNYPSNLQLLCPPCNLSKNNKDPIVYAQMTGRLI